MVGESNEVSGLLLVPFDQSEAIREAMEDRDSLPILIRALREDRMVPRRRSYKLSCKQE